MQMYFKKYKENLAEEARKIGISNDIDFIANISEDECAEFARFIYNCIKMGKID